MITPSAQWNAKTVVASSASGLRPSPETLGKGFFGSRARKSPVIGQSVGDNVWPDRDRPCACASKAPRYWAFQLSARSDLRRRRQVRKGTQVVFGCDQA